MNELNDENRVYSQILRNYFPDAVVDSPVDKQIINKDLERINQKICSLLQNQRINIDPKLL